MLMKITIYSTDNNNDDTNKVIMHHELRQSKAHPLLGDEPPFGTLHVHPSRKCHASSQHDIVMGAEMETH